MPLDFQSIAAIVFLVVLSFFLYVKRGKLSTKKFLRAFNFSMYKTRLGLNSMDYISKRHYKAMSYAIGLILFFSGIFFDKIVTMDSIIVTILQVIFSITGILILIRPSLLGYVIITYGFLGMLILIVSLFQNTYDLFTKPEASPGVGLVLPFEAKGVVYVPFLYWIISLFIVALIHEFAHGVVARSHNINVKSSGFAFIGSDYRWGGLILIVIFGYIKIRNAGFDVTGAVASLSSFNSMADLLFILGVSLFVISFFKNPLVPIIPAAFVEPDEKKLGKRPHSQQLSVFAAGPFSNILLGLILLGFAAFAFSPLLDSMTELTGAKISGLTEGFPAASSGLAEGEVIKQIDDAEIKSVGEFSDYLREKKPGSTIDLETDRNSYSIRLAQSPTNESAGYLGVYVRQNAGIKESFKQKYGSFMPNVILWLSRLLNWLIILNLGIGLFNLIPIGPIDGGRMMHLVLLKVFKNGEKANRVWHSISLVFLLIVLVIIIKACAL